MFPKPKPAKEQNVNVWRLVLESRKRYTIILQFWKLSKIGDNRSSVNAKNTPKEAKIDPQGRKARRTLKRLRAKKWPG